MNQPPCNECSTGPRGVEGHQDLALHVSAAGEGGAQKAAFRCARCGTEWIRTYMGSGVFAWNRVV